MPVYEVYNIQVFAFKIAHDDGVIYGLYIYLWFQWTQKSTMSKFFYVVWHPLPLRGWEGASLTRTAHQTVKKQQYSKLRANCRASIKNKNAIHLKSQQNLLCCFLRSLSSNLYTSRKSFHSVFWLPNGLLHSARHMNKCQWTKKD